jgi:hypothetical protein
MLVTVTRPLNAPREFHGLNGYVSNCGDREAADLFGNKVSVRDVLRGLSDKGGAAQFHSKDTGGRLAPCSATPTGS